MTEREDTTGLWIGVPSVPAGRIGQAFVSFYLAIGIAIAVDVLLLVNNRGPDGWHTVAEQVFADGGSIIAWALASTWPIMEVFRMVLASLWENRIRRRAMEQGRAKGREENQRLWEAWLERRQQAEDRGEIFTEPPPGDGSNESP